MNRKGLDVYCIVLYCICIPLQSVFFLLYNATLFVTIASCRAEILSYISRWWGPVVELRYCRICGGVRKNVPNLAHQNIWDTVLIKP